MGYTMADLCDGISIHAPHEGERRQSVSDWTSGKRFQSTLPTRGSDEYR